MSEIDELEAFEVAPVPSEATSTAARQAGQRYARRVLARGQGAWIRKALRERVARKAEPSLPRVRWLERPEP